MKLNSAQTKEVQDKIDELRASINDYLWFGKSDYYLANLDYKQGNKFNNLAALLGDAEQVHELANQLAQLQDFERLIKQS